MRLLAEYLRGDGIGVIQHFRVRHFPVL